MVAGPPGVRRRRRRANAVRGVGQVPDGREVGGPWVCPILDVVSKCWQVKQLSCIRWISSVGSTEGRCPDSRHTSLVNGLSSLLDPAARCPGCRPGSAMTVDRLRLHEVSGGDGLGHLGGNGDEGDSF